MKENQRIEDSNLKKRDSVKRSCFEVLNELLEEENIQGMGNDGALKSGDDVIKCKVGQGKENISPRIEKSIPVNPNKTRSQVRPMLFLGPTGTTSLPRSPKCPSLWFRKVLISTVSQKFRN